jgi:DNA-binding transcriptional MerR regulator
MSLSNLQLPTVGEIARRLGVEVHRVEYVIRTRRVTPAGRAGNALVYTDQDVERIASELNRIARERNVADAR